MKLNKIMLLVLASFLAQFLFAQPDNSSGVVVYERSRKIEITLQGEAAQYQDRVPRERKSKNELLFTQDASLFRQVPRNAEEDIMQEGGGGGPRMMMMRMMEPEEFVFSELKTKKNTEQREFMTRKFIIESSTDTIRWKLTGNQKMILDYMCLEAILVGSSKKTVTWFTPSIPVSSGPDGYGGLPGLILSLDIDEGRTTIIPLSIDLKEPDLKLIAKPKEGKKVTRKEYDQMVEEKMKEMGQGPGGGQFYIRRH